MIYDQRGQTLIETIVAVFVLTTALVSGLSLVIFALSSSKTGANEIIATNLAREGIEAVRMMRDTNWLEGDVKGGAWDLELCDDISSACYPRWLDGPSGGGYSNYDINVSNNSSRWRLEYNQGSRNWSLVNNSNYNLYLQADGSYTHTVNGSSVFARRIRINYNESSPYTEENPELIVESIVGWRGKNCTAMTGQNPETTNCKVIVQENMTNWKDYE